MALPYRRRTSKACVNCHSRKVRCEFDSNRSGGCKRCRAERVLCQERIVRRRRMTADANTETSYPHEASQDPLSMVSSSRETLSAASNIDRLRNNLLTPDDALHILGSRENESYVEQQNTEIATIQDTDIVKKGILPAEIVPILIEFFFQEIGSFHMPRIPAEYRTPELYKETPLLAVICTLGARHREDDCYADMHKRLWAYCEDTLGKAMWQCQTLKSGSSCSSTRSMIFALLILSDWIPGAFFLEEPSQLPVDFVRKYTAKCWLYVGYAIKLAQFLGLLQHDKLIYFELHASESALTCRLGRISTLDDLPDPCAFQEIIECLSRKEKAVLDLFKLYPLANKTMYKSRAHTIHLCRTGEYTDMLQMFENIFSKWQFDYSDTLLEGDDDEMDVKFEYDYCKLYILSISIAPYSSFSQDRFSRIDESEKFLHSALEAARSVIVRITAVDPVHNTPQRWASRLIHAVTFLAKVLISEPRKYFCNANLDIFTRIKEFGSVLDKSAIPRYERYSKLLGSFCCKLSECQEMIYMNEKYNGESTQSRSIGSRSDPRSPLRDNHHSHPLSLEELFPGYLIDFSETWLDSMPCTVTFTDN